MHTVDATSHLDMELAAFQKELPSMLSKYGAGQFALFIQGIFKGAFTDRLEAMKNGYSLGGPGRFLVRKITEKDEVYHVASPISVG